MKEEREIYLGVLKESGKKREVHTILLPFNCINCTSVAHLLHICAV
jgi:hypothetical protein